tara:strand:+ start:14 stop:319 length:306 start_codon:yes stop_codon:yes gene_type:complete
MNYQLLLECYASGSEITQDELQMLEIELDTQIENIKLSRTQLCLKIAPKHICKAALVCQGSTWISCLASVFDKCSTPTLGQKTKGAIVFDELVRQGYLITD